MDDTVIRTVVAMFENMNFRNFAAQHTRSAMPRRCQNVIFISYLVASTYMSENDRPTRRGSRRQFVRRVTGTLATTGLLGVAGCAGNRTESGDDGQSDAESGMRTREENSTNPSDGQSDTELVTRTVEGNVTGPGDRGDIVAQGASRTVEGNVTSPSDGGDVVAQGASSSFPEGPPGWVDTNLEWTGWYSVEAYNPYGWDYEDDKCYFYNNAGVDFDAKCGETPVTASLGYAGSCITGGKLKFDVVGSDGYLNVALPEGGGHEVWFEGPIGNVTYWIGIV
jgi:hypothetical protein